jgi:hypothetical protein
MNSIIHPCQLFKITPNLYLCMGVLNSSPETLSNPRIPRFRSCGEAARIFLTDLCLLSSYATERRDRGKYYINVDTLPSDGPELCSTDIYMAVDEVFCRTTYNKATITVPKVTPPVTIDARLTYVSRLQKAI